MIRRFLFICAVLVIVISCTYVSLEKESNNSDLIIKTGTICGWCTVNDTLIIARNAVRYVNYTNCNVNKPSVEKAGQISARELDALLAKLDLNSSNVSFDGCDDWIYFKNGTENHYIRFTKNDPKLKPIQAFVDQLNAIKTQYSVAK